MRRLVLGVATIALATMTLSWAMAGDQDIARKITEQLRKEQEAGNLRGFNINLKILEGTVRLKGHVSCDEQEKLAEEVAREVEGVKDVINELEIKSAFKPGEVAFKRGDFALAQEKLESFKAEYPHHDLAEKADKYLRKIAQAEAATRVENEDS